jgi:hypothetical protein
MEEGQMKAEQERDPGPPYGSPTGRAEDDAREEARRVAGEMTGHWYRLQGVVASLPPRGGDPEAEDVAVELRDVIACVLVDSIGPAIRDLLSAASYPNEAEELQEQRRGRPDDLLADGPDSLVPEAPTP